MLIAIGGIILAVVLGGAGYLGLFHGVHVEEGQCGPFKFVYREMSGANMKKVREITDSLAALPTAQGISQRKPLNVYFPDGSAQIGFAVEGAPEAKLAALSGEAKIRDIPAGRCMKAEFPWKNPMSFMVGYMKVDPALKKHRESHGYKKVEAMTLNLDQEKSILYLQPVVKQ